MLFPSTVFLRNIAGTGVKTFARTISSGLNELVYTSLTTLNSGVYMKDLLKIRATPSKDLGKLPYLQKSSYNVHRLVQIKGADGNPYDLTVNLTVVTPGGNVISASLIRETISDVLTIASNVEGVGGSEGASHDSTVSIEFVTAAQILQL